MRTVHGGRVGWFLCTTMFVKLAVAVPNNNLQLAKVLTCPLTGTKPLLNAVPPLEHCRWYQDFSCCSNKQTIHTHHTVLQKYGPKFQHCPGCLHNIEVLHCAMTCSPSQNNFVLTTPQVKRAKSPRVAVRICHSFCLDLYRSCAGALPDTGTGKNNANTQSSLFRQDLTSVLEASAKFCTSHLAESFGYLASSFDVVVVDDLDRASNVEHKCIGQFDMPLVEPVCDPYSVGTGRVDNNGTIKLPWRYEVSVVCAFFVVLGGVICAGYAMYRVQMKAKEMEYGEYHSQGFSPGRTLRRARESYFVDERDSIGDDEHSGLLSAEL